MSGAVNIKLEQKMKEEIERKTKFNYENNINGEYIRKY